MVKPQKRIQFFKTLPILGHSFMFKVAPKQAHVTPHLGSLCKDTTVPWNSYFFFFFKNISQSNFLNPIPGGFLALGAHFALGQGVGFTKCWPPHPLSILLLVIAWKKKKGELSLCFCYKHGLKQIMIWYFCRKKSRPEQTPFLFFS